jgi:formylglycine-generating enzyme required for sulfatase activity
MLKEFSRAAPLPPLLSEVAAATAHSADEDFLEATRALIAEFAFFVDSEAELRELVYALALLETRGGPFFHLSLSRLAQTARDLLGPADTEIYWIVAALESAVRSGGIARGLIDTAAFERFHLGYLQQLQQRADPATSGVVGAVSIGGLRFLPVPGGVVRMGRTPDEARGRIDSSMPYLVLVEPLLFGRTEVTRDLFSRFLAEQPEFQPGRVDAPGYLEGWVGAVYPEGTGAFPVTGVSHGAAEAFCDWLTTRVPASLRGYEVRLPSEAEWDWAARGAGQDRPSQDSVFLDSGELAPAAEGGANSLGLIGLWGSVWEWTADWYFPASHLLASEDPARNPLFGSALGSQRVVKGGSWANSRQEIREQTRGAQPVDWATPYTGFRVVLAPAQD